MSRCVDVEFEGVFQTGILGPDQFGQCDSAFRILLSPNSPKEAPDLLVHDREPVRRIETG